MRLIFALTLCTNPAWAACDTSYEKFMSCSFPNGKAVEVCTDGNFVDYTFGYPGQQPELAITLAYQEGAEAVPWNGVGRTIWEAIRLTNNDVTYEVYGGFDKQAAVEWDPETEPNPMFGGIFIEDVDGNELAHMRCTAGTVDYGY